MCHTTKANGELSTRWSAMLLLACILFGASCTSIESTMVTRDDTNQTWERHNCLNGIPITLKVPTHVKIYVFNTSYLEVVKDSQGKTLDIIPVELDIVVRDVAHELMYTDKIFVVDFKRPAAGSANLKLKMTDQQYIDEIQHDITDETITQVANLLGGLVGSAGLRVRAVAAAGELKADIIPLRSLVAAGIFEVDSPDFEHRIKEFLNCHVNKAHDAWVVPPDVTSINRVGIRPSDNLQIPHPDGPLCPGDREHSAITFPQLRPPDASTFEVIPEDIQPQEDLPTPSSARKTRIRRRTASSALH